MKKLFLAGYILMIVFMALAVATTFYNYHKTDTILNILIGVSVLMQMIPIGSALVQAYKNIKELTRRLKDL